MMITSDAMLHWTNILPLLHKWAFPELLDWTTWMRLIHILLKSVCRSIIPSVIRHVLDALVKLRAPSLFKWDRFCTLVAKQNIANGELVKAAMRP